MTDCVGKVLLEIQLARKSVLVYKCVSCGEFIKNDRSVIRVDYGWHMIFLCPACGWEIVDLLQDKKPIKLDFAKPVG